MQEDDRHLSKLVLPDRHLSDSWCQRIALPRFVIIPQKLRMVGTGFRGKDIITNITLVERCVLTRKPPRSPLMECLSHLT